MLDFKTAGYQTQLVYFGLDNIEKAVSRMRLRVELGHDLPDDVIRFNMEEGIKRVQADLGLYDVIRFVDIKRIKEHQLSYTRPPHT